MKRIILFFTVCLGLSVLQTGTGFASENARTNAKRNSPSAQAANISNTRSEITTKKGINQNAAENARTAATNSRTNSSKNNAPIRTTVKTRNTATVTTKNVSNRSQNNIGVRGTTNRSGTSSRNIEQKTTASRIGTTQKNATRISRAATLNEDKIASIKSKDYSKCRTVYYDCMDEFCANKDSDLRRCACSARIHEFDDIKKQLSAAEDKMLDFNQRLLMVGLDKEDAAAINTATEGEIAYSAKDTSESEKLLKKITDSLNSSDNSKLNNNLAAISLSLDIDSAWDSVDSMAGISTTSKNGIELYNAAQPICVEMAQEVCSNEELEIAQNSYKLSIQQDCNTVAKSYDSQYNQAMEKIHESGALLDMSRLNTYQQRNSDDILTCKKKILDQMSVPSVCGENLYKCLDISGQYIDPSNGNAFLSNDLYNITTLLTAPTGNETWSTIPQNNQFVTYLNSKKKFLESATDQCQDIADTVWKDFLNDALAQIKLAQIAKVEEIRQSCTTLVAECKTKAHQSLTDFDARALSTFEVIADSTANALCMDVENSCTSLLNSSGGGGIEWESGMVEIASDISYDAILNNCKTVGRDCIIQQCNGTAGNFALCGDYSASPRRAILKRNACWNEVLNCVNQSTNLNNVKSPIVQNRTDFYSDFYGISNPTSVPQPCTSDDIACLITEQIWGNCEYDAGSTAITTNDYLVTNSNDIVKHNKILQPKTEEDSTLLSWLAYNTGTTDANDSCSAYNCPTDYRYDATTKKCRRMVRSGNSTTDGENLITMDEIIYVNDSITNYCAGGAASKDLYGNCCASGAVSNGICVPDGYNAIVIQSAYCDTTMDLAEAPSYYCPDYTTNATSATYRPSDNKAMSLYCVTTANSVSVDSNGTLSCNGYLVVVDKYGNYTPVLKISETQIGTGDDAITILDATQISATPTMSYKTSPTTTCTYEYDIQYKTVQDSNQTGYSTYDGAASQWQWKSGNSICPNSPGKSPKDNEFIISY